MNTQEGRVAPVVIVLGKLIDEMVFPAIGQGQISVIERVGILWVHS